MKNPTFNPDKVIIHLWEPEYKARRDKEAQLLSIGKQDLVNDAYRRGYVGVQYHYALLRDGTLLSGVPHDRRAYHLLGHDHEAWGIVIVGPAPSPCQVLMLDAVIKDSFNYTPIVWAKDLAKRRKEIR